MVMRERESERERERERRERGRERERERERNVDITMRDSDVDDGDDYLGAKGSRAQKHDINTTTLTMLRNWTLSESHCASRQGNPDSNQ